MNPRMRSLPRFSAAAFLAAALVLMPACHGGGGGDHSSTPRTNIDLAMTAFTAVPDYSDPEDILTLSGTIANVGTETANPLQGDSFLVRFNLSTDGTFEVDEQGFYEFRVTDPIPPGGSVNFSRQAAYGGGFTLTKFGNFCSSVSCAAPQVGLIGVKAAALDEIREVEEGNNFQFATMKVAGTLISASAGGCNFGMAGGPGSPGCDLTLVDYHGDKVTIHQPCSGGGCNPYTVIFPNELNRTISAYIVLRGCTLQSCGGGWTINGVTTKVDSTGQSVTSTLSTSFTCNGPPSNQSACSKLVDVRDPNF